MVASLEQDLVVKTLGGILPRTLVALDFDGTLAPIVPEPSEARAVPGALDALLALAAHGAQIAIVTGRRASVVVELGQFGSIPNLMVEGVYGAEHWSDGSVRLEPVPVGIGGVREIVEREAHRHGLWVEDKRSSLVVHARNVTRPAEALAEVREALSSEVERLGLELHSGRAVLEIRAPGHDKGGALARLVKLTSPLAVLFAGDDEGDVPAFEEIARLRAEGLKAWSVAVRSAEVPNLAMAASFSVPSQAELVHLLAHIVSRGHERSKSRE